MNPLMISNNIDNDVEQIKRYEKAVLNTVELLSVDKDSLCAIFLGSTDEIYETTLTNCTCSDFSRRNLPCKHMYKLAIELDVIDPDSKQWKKYSSYSTKLNNIKKKINKLSIEQLDDLSKYLKEINAWK